MNTYITRKQVREINKKLFANDIIYSDDSKAALEEIIATIIQIYNPEDKVSRVPSILELKSENIDKDSIDKVMLLNPESVYIQINNNILIETINLELIKKLKSYGYKIIVELNKDDKNFTITSILADIIKIDIHNIPEALMKSEVRFNSKLFAYNIDSANSYALAETLHIDLYEGNYVSPESSVKLEVKESYSFNYIEVLSLVEKENANINDIAKAIAKDTLMCAQVIRLANSVYFMGNGKISSVEQAVVRIGLDKLKKWLFILQFNNKDMENAELLQTSYNRALLCEEIAKASRKIKINENNAYLIGLFSTLDALTGKQIDKQLYGMNLSKDIEDALIYREGQGGMILNLVKSYEEANWERVDKYIKEFGLSKQKMCDIYFKCMDEVIKLWSSLTGLGGVA